MNKFMSQAFGVLLNIMHVIVAIALTFTVFRSSSDMVTGIAILSFVGYVFLVGIAATAIAIRENLEELIKVAKE
jgi:hypothetical protein